MGRGVFSLAVCVLMAAPAFSQLRSFQTLFPDYDETKRAAVFSQNGLLETSSNAKALKLLPAFLAPKNIAGPVLSRSPSFLIESLIVIPAQPRPADVTAIYNALRRARDLKGRLYPSFSRNKEVPLFEDATQVAGEKNTTPIPDPPRASRAPASDAVFMKLKDVNFGNSYYRLDIAAGSYGLVCGLTNFRTLSYTVIPVIRERKFVAQLYIESLAEGLLVYSLAGADVSDFIASKIDMPSAIRKRIEVIIGWIIDGIAKEA
ncbi:MAG: hypothetical protein LBD37_07245 [Treponema sp.]|jgi:hypothetical protein|nr:hypothetical protein [Treponema sp.]